MDTAGAKGAHLLPGCLSVTYGGRGGHGGLASVGCRWLTGPCWPSSAASPLSFSFSLFIFFFFCRNEKRRKGIEILGLFISERFLLSYKASKPKVC